MLKKNLNINLLDSSLEDVLELRSTNTRKDIVLEIKLSTKVVISIEELKQAIELIEKFSSQNPLDLGQQILVDSGVMQVEYLDRSEDI